MAVTIDLTGKVAFVTGSTRGIGWATACALSAAGAHVVLNGVSNPSLLEERLQTLKTQSEARHSALAGDVSDPVSVSRFYQQIFKDYRRLDILVNNAGIMESSPLGLITSDQLRHTFDVNASSVILNMQSAARLMARSGGGSIVNLTSIVGRNGATGQAAYAASKAAVVGATLAAAKELAAQHIRVNAISPGFIETDLTRQLPEATIQQTVERIGMKRPGNPADVASAVLFLASDLASYVTGQILGIDGGMVL